MKRSGQHPTPVSSRDDRADLQERALNLAEHFCSRALFQVPRSRHNWKLEQARLVGKAVLTLAGAWRLSGDRRFAKRAWEIIEEVAGWSCWTWEKLHQPYDLTTGELASTFALADEWMGDSLGPEQKELMRHAVQRHVFAGILECYRPGKPADRQQWWLRAGSNWNAVCNGGAAMAALQWPELPESSRVGPLVWPGLETYCDKGIQRDGSSLESIGYWQYGLIYLSRAVLCWEVRHRKQHPILTRHAFREGLDFPFDFSPGGAAIGFGDANYFAPPAALLPFFLRTGRHDLAAEVFERLSLLWKGKSPDQFDPYVEPWPDEIYAALHASECAGSTPSARHPMRVYPDCGWAVFHSGQMSLSFRAGSTSVLHAMRELLAVNLAVAGRCILSGCENWPYPCGWFAEEKRDPVRGRSRSLYWEDNTTSKNAPLVNGIGQVAYGESNWVVDEGSKSVRADATETYPLMVRKISRTVRRREASFEICDLWEAESPCWFEARFHVPDGGIVKMEVGTVIIERNKIKVRLAFASPDGKVRITVAPVCPSVPSKPAVTMIRAWMEKPMGGCTITTVIEQLP